MPAPLCPHCGCRKSRAVLPSRDPLEYYCPECRRHWLAVDQDRTQPPKRPRRKPKRAAQEALAPHRQPVDHLRGRRPFPSPTEALAGAAPSVFTVPVSVTTPSDVSTSILIASSVSSSVILDLILAVIAPFPSAFLAWLAADAAVFSHLGARLAGALGADRPRGPHRVARSAHPPFDVRERPPAQQESTRRRRARRPAGPV